MTDTGTGSEGATLVAVEPAAETWSATAAEVGWERAALSVAVRAAPQRLEVRRGDMLIANRLSSTQAVMNVSKDPWTHAALVGSVDGRLVAIELGPRGCSHRSLPEFVAAYRAVGVARPQMHAACIDAIASTAELHLAFGDITYSWDTCTVLESIALLRCFLPARVEPAVVGFASIMAGRLLRRTAPTAMTCAGFVDLCLSAACPSCRPDPVWPRRERTPPWRGMPSMVDLWRRRLSIRVTEPLAVRALSTPADLWLAECWQHRVVYRPDRTTLIYELDDPERRAA